MNDGNHTGNAQKLPIAERARQGALLSEPALLREELLELEHPGDLIAQTALNAAIETALRFGGLRSSLRPLPDGCLPADELLERESYCRWRAQCPKRLLSDLSQIDAWLGQVGTLWERARLGLPLALNEVVYLEHPTDKVARKALGAALRVDIDSCDLPATIRRWQRPGNIRRRWRIGGIGEPVRIELPPVQDPPVQCAEYRLERESYCRWRAQCPKRLLSDLSKIDKWLGAMPTPVESLPESLPESSKRGIALVEAENAALVALRKALKREPDFEEFWDYLTTKDETGTVAAVSYTHLTLPTNREV